MYFQFDEKRFNQLCVYKLIVCILLFLSVGQTCPKVKESMTDIDKPVVYNREKWLEENQKFFLPPICNKMM